MSVTFAQVAEEMKAVSPFFKRLEEDIKKRPDLFNEAIAVVERIFQIMKGEEVEVIFDSYIIKRDDSHLNRISWNSFYPYKAITYPLKKISPFLQGNFRPLGEDAMSYQTYWLPGTEFFLGKQWWFQRRLTETGAILEIACNYEPPKELQASGVFFRVFHTNQPFYDGDWSFKQDFNILSDAIKYSNEANQVEKGHFIVEQIDWVVPRQKRYEDGDGSGIRALSFQTGKYENYRTVSPI